MKTPEYNGSESFKDLDSDANFESDGLSDNEENYGMENRGVKRKLSENEANPVKKSKKNVNRLKKENRIKKLHKPPTANELNRLRETENLFHSNLFRLQIEEMLKEVQLKESHKVEFDLWYEKFSDWIMKAEDNDNKYQITDQEWLKKFNIKIPIPQIPYSVKGTYQFKKPHKVSIFGSYSTNLVIGPKITVDVLVEMPDSFFQKEDYLNCRFHRKRALYLCELIHHIQLLPNLVEDVVFVGEEVDKLKPNVEITPFGRLSKHVKVVLHVGIAEETYKLNRFTPIKNNVRTKWYFKENNDEQDIIPTPFYNSTIAAELTLQQNMQFLKDTVSCHKTIKDGIILLKVWLRQRELHDSISGFNGFIISMLVCYLLKIKKLNFLMSSYQIFRNVCYYLCDCDWTKNGISLCDSKEDENLPTLSDYHSYYQVVFVDVTGYHNLCYAMSSCFFENIRQEARLAYKWLNDPNINSFQVLFITKVPFYQHYDQVVVFNNSEMLENIADVHCSKESQLSHCSIISPLVRESIVSLLSRGFGKRIKFLFVKLPERTRWKLMKNPPQKLTLILGFNLDPENYFTVVDKALETETEAFREFWGEKSELRRFQDGSITEALVWSARTLSEKRLICYEILTYLLKSKFGLNTNHFQYIANQLDSQIGNDIEELSLKVAETFDELSKQLRMLKELPLSIISVQGTSPVFRYSDPLPPVPQYQRNTKTQTGSSSRNYALINSNLKSSPPWINPIDVIVHLAASNKWPQNLEAIKRLKAAFNIKISDSLNQTYGLISKSFPDKVEVVKEGFVFRIKLIYSNEIALHKHTIDSDGLVKYKDTEKSLALEKEYTFLPKLTSVLHGIYQEHNSFGPACCIIKRWISSHLIDKYYMSEESIELLVASLYLRPEPHEPPVQPQVALFRFYQLMINTNWNSDCIVLNINGELTQEDILEIESDFNANRQNLPAVFIATPYDRSKSIWTKDSPTPLILLRLIQLCVDALKIVEGQFYSKALSESKELFKPCLDTYDVIITLNESYNSKKKAKERKTAEMLVNFVQKIPINDFDPVSLFLKELRDAYGDLALFFHDTYGGSVIAVKWKPNTLEPCDFKLNSLPAHIYDTKLKKIKLNLNSVLEDFWILGLNLVDHIDVRENDLVLRFELFK